jgi:hypothetical protein
MGCLRVRNLRLANQEDEMSIAGRRNGLALRIGAIMLALLVTSGGLAGVAHAQAVGALLSGLITDERGGPVPGATVSIKNVGTGVVREVSTNGDGLYSAPNLLPGTYEVRVTAQGFQTLVQKEIGLTVGAQQALNVSLKVGQLNQTVVVSAAPPEVQTSSSTISATVDSNTVRELPLNGRDWTSLAALEPGVTSIPNQAGRLWKPVERCRSPRQRKQLPCERYQHQRLLEWSPGRRDRTEFGSGRNPGVFRTYQ